MREYTLGRNLLSVSTVKSALGLPVNARSMTELVRNVSSVGTVKAVLQLVVNVRNMKEHTLGRSLSSVII